MRISQGLTGISTRVRMILRRPASSGMSPLEAIRCYIRIMANPDSHKENIGLVMQ